VNFPVSVESKNVTNFLKSIFMGRCVKKEPFVIDWGCGMGVDVAKLHYLHPSQVLFVDISELNLQEANRRWQEKHFPYFVSFLQDNFCSPDFCSSQVILKFMGEKQGRTPGQQRELAFQGELHCGLEPFADVIVSNFSAHYSFYSWESAKQMIRNVSKCLRRGGVFNVFLPRGSMICDQLRIPHQSIVPYRYSTIRYYNATSSSINNVQNADSACKNTVQHQENTECIQYSMLESDFVSMCCSIGPMKLLRMESLRKLAEEEFYNPKNTNLKNRIQITESTISEECLQFLSNFCYCSFIKL